MIEPQPQAQGSGAPLLPLIDHLHLALAAPAHLLPNHHCHHAPAGDAAADGTPAIEAAAGVVRGGRVRGPDWVAQCVEGSLHGCSNRGKTANWSSSAALAQPS